MESSGRLAGPVVRFVYSNLTARKVFGASPRLELVESGFKKESKATLGFELTAVAKFLLNSVSDHRSFKRFIHAVTYAANGETIEYWRE